MTIYLLEGEIIIGGPEGYADNEDDLVIPNADTDPAKHETTHETTVKDLTRGAADTEEDKDTPDSKRKAA